MSLIKANLREQAGWTADYFYPTPLVDYQRVHKEAKAAVTEIRAGRKASAAQAASRQKSVKSSQPRASKKKASSDPSQMALF